MREHIDAATATAQLSAASGVPYSVVGPLAGGETGAWKIRRADGVCFVLKWDADIDNQRIRRDGARLARRLRTEARWPSPELWLIDRDGILFIVQEFMEGGNVAHLSHALIDRVWELHEARSRLASTDTSVEWGRGLLRTLVHGGDGYCLHEPLRRFDARTRNVIERIETIGRSTDPEDLDGGDIVHFDLHPGNLLEVDGRLTAVVDMDFTCVGDATFDLTTLAITSLDVTADPGVRARLFDWGIASLPEPKRRVYVAHLLLRLLDWAVRGTRHVEIEFWLAQTERLLPH